MKPPIEIKKGPGMRGNYPASTMGKEGHATIGPHTHNPRPPDIDGAWDYIFGDLICNKCRKPIATACVQHSNNGSAYIQTQVAQHICETIDFPYSFTDTRTIKEQQADAYTRAAKAVNNELPPLFR